MNIEELATLTSPGGSLISVYLDRPPGQASAAITDALKPLKAKGDSLPRAVAMSLRSDLERIAGLEPDIDSEIAPGYCIFASHADGLFEFHRVPAPVGDHASVGRRPYMRPLRALPRPLRAGVAVADRRNAWLFISDNGELNQLELTIEAESLKDNYGGFRGYEEYGVRQHAAEETARVLKEAAEKLFEAHQARPFDFLAVGGHKESLEDLVRYLHRYLRELPRRTFVVDPHTMTPAVLSAKVGDLANDVRRAESRAAIADVLEATSRGEMAASGLRRVIEAANAHAPELLAVSAPLSSPGVVCPQCEWIGLTERTCPVCSIAVDEVDDVIGHVIETVVGTGGSSVESGESQELERLGVAARLRFPV